MFIPKLVFKFMDLTRMEFSSSSKYPDSSAQHTLSYHVDLSLILVEGASSASGPFRLLDRVAADPALAHVRTVVPTCRDAILPSLSRRGTWESLVLPAGLDQLFHISARACFPGAPAGTRGPAARFDRAA